jgi:glucose/arabinose dehydrogenase
LNFSTGIAFLGQNDILVSELKSGIVRRIVNNEMLDDPLLDVNVAHKSERGLLGLAVTKTGTDDEINVLLYYTESSTDSDGHEVCEVRNYCKSGNPIGHRLYKYDLKNNKLINPQLLLDLPPNPGAAHHGGVITLDSDNNVYVITGDGDSCEFQTCKKNLNSSVINAQTANVQSGDLPMGRGGILRVTLDGEQVGNGSGILAREYPLNLYYAYGIRNSFGMDFDPVTGYLWDTENGPAFGDEINLVEPGFNSGWLRVQGFWPIDDYALLDSVQKFNGYPGDKESSEEPENLVDFNNQGKYSNPEFSWNQTIGVTALNFLNSDKLGKQYENDMFVGDTRGNLYHFDLNQNRTQLKFNGPLQDKIAGDSREAVDIAFGHGFGGGIIDIETGPEGYLYILSGDGSINKIYRSQTS